MAKARRSKTGQNPPDSAHDTSLPTNPHDGADERPGAYSSDQIAARAYELYLARGAADGQDFDDWIAAERELATGPSHDARAAGSPRSERSE
jgi:hypothetical protein